MREIRTSHEPKSGGRNQPPCVSPGVGYAQRSQKPFGRHITMIPFCLCAALAHKLQEDLLSKRITFLPTIQQLQRGEVRKAQGRAKRRPGLSYFAPLGLICRIR